MDGRNDTLFSPWRAFFWPVHSFELKKLLPMLLIFFLLSFDYNVLRTMKDVLVVTAKSSGAEVIPFIKVWVMFPGSILLTYIYTRLTNRFSRETVFHVILGIFLTYFLIFAVLLYPNRDYLHLHSVADRMQTVLPAGFKGFIAMVRYWSFTSFYVMSELWSNIILFLLFWGFANQVTRLHEAKRFYGLFGIGANFSGIIAGLVSIYVCQYDENALEFVGKWDEKMWERSMDILIAMVLFSGLLAMALFRWMHTQVITQQEPSESTGKLEKPPRMSMRRNFATLFQSRYLLCIAAVVISYNLVINLVEVLWKHEVRTLYPNPNDYSLYMNQVTAMIGVIATFTSLFVSGNIIRRFGWTFTAMITPAILLITSLGFFGFMFVQGHLADVVYAAFGMTPLALVVFFGTAQNCLSRAAKYTVYDVTKEMAFVPLDSFEKEKGKAAVDGVCSRLGKSGGSVIHQSLLMIFATLTASAPYVAVVLFFVIIVWSFSVLALGREFNLLTRSSEEMHAVNSQKKPLAEQPV